MAELSPSSSQGDAYEHSQYQHYQLVPLEAIPPPSIPYHNQPPHGHWFFRPPPPMTISYTIHPQPTAQHPFFMPPPSTPPTWGPVSQVHLPTQHQVWNVNCASCEVLLSNRGMRAVLLLRPQISLYSTDAVPINCSSPPPSALPTTYVPRTCDCLTQVLCCHGCGNTVGYSIVVACAKCTASIPRQQPSANGHRFVFHHTEVKATERLYTSDEPGVPLPRLPTSNSHSSHFSESKSLPDLESLDTTTVNVNMHSTRPSPTAPGFRRGDPVFWHHLLASGEMPGCESSITSAQRPRMLVGR